MKNVLSAAWKIVSIVSMLIFSQLSKGFADQPKTVMLVLGSADPAVLQERVNVASRLYQTQAIHILIVSGGCGAHGSQSCEATAMYEGLVAKGVPAHKIYREENAKTTVQNYIFSRKLRDENGRKIIQPKDTVFVVSNHWHAISVAARLQQHDGVQARFYIEGAITPNPNDKLDYVNIFHGEPNNSKFVEKGAWLTPDLMWQEGSEIFYLMDAMIYRTNANNTAAERIPRASLFPTLEQLDKHVQWAFIDNDRHWYIRVADKLFSMDKKTKIRSKERSWSSFIQNMPLSWKNGAFNTGYILGDELLLFANDRILIARKKGKYFEFFREGSAQELIENWPFTWGKSNVAAVTVDYKKKEAILFRNMEFLKIDAQKKVIEKAQKLKLTWID